MYMSTHICIYAQKCILSVCTCLWPPWTHVPKYINTNFSVCIMLLYIYIYRTDHLVFDNQLECSSTAEFPCCQPSLVDNSLLCRTGNSWAAFFVHVSMSIVTVFIPHVAKSIVPRWLNYTTSDIYFGDFTWSNSIYVNRIFKEKIMLLDGL